jgi:hypothetical protein
MKGDVTSLRQALHDNFSEADMGVALKLLWDHSSAALEATGFWYHQRRGSEKSPLAELVVNDLLSAFDKLDSCNKLPHVFCGSCRLSETTPNSH